jgi:hypothetical protein
VASPASRGSSGPLPVAGRSACPGSARRAARDRAVQDQPCTSAASPRAEEQDWQGEQMHGEGAEALASVLPAAGSRPRGLAAVRHVPRHSAQLWLCARSRTTWGTASPGSVWTRRGTRASTPTAGGAPLASSHGWRGRRFRATSRNRRSRLSTRLHRSARRDLVRPRRLVTGPPTTGLVIGPHPTPRPESPRPGGGRRLVTHDAGEPSPTDRASNWAECRGALARGATARPGS